MIDPRPSLQEVMMLWSRGMNTADIARKFVCAECDVTYTLHVGLELQRAARLAEAVGTTTEKIA